MSFSLFIRLPDLVNWIVTMHLLISTCFLESINSSWKVTVTMVSFITTFFTSIFAGFNFTSDWDRDRDPLDAKYFCRLGNRNGVIQSNTIEVQDIDSYRTGKFTIKTLFPFC